MVFTESFKFAAATVIFLRHFIKAVASYMNDAKQTISQKPKGQGMGKTLPDKLPTAVDIKRVIPKHCFEPTVLKSMWYVLRDAVQIGLAFWVIIQIQAVPSALFRAVAMFFYWAVQGTFFTAVFVIGHDCGHGSFSKSPLLNDVVGTVMHSFLMCPYYMWKLTHHIHHKNNCNFEKDEVFYPIKKSDPASKGYTLPGFGFGAGWFGYLVFGYKPRDICHFNVRHRAFAGHVLGCSMSIVGLSCMAYILYRFSLVYGLWGMLCYWGVPCFIFASYCVIITFLHHSEVSIPWYSSSRWDFVRGQLSTVDRHYGAVHHLLHSIGTHQMHHMFTRIPHYHLEEATRHFRKAFPDLVRVCDESILPSFMRMYSKFEVQSAMDDNTEVHYYE